MTENVGFTMTDWTLLYVSDTVFTVCVCTCTRCAVLHMWSLPDVVRSRSKLHPEPGSFHSNEDFVFYHVGSQWQSADCSPFTSPSTRLWVLLEVSSCYSFFFSVPRSELETFLHSLESELPPGDLCETVSLRVKTWTFTKPSPNHALRVNISCASSVGSG